MRQPIALRIVEQLEQAWGEHDFDRFYAALEAVRHLPQRASSFEQACIETGQVTDGD
jgi:hypothetical protein